VTTKVDDARRDLATLGTGLLLLSGWLTFAGAAFAMTSYLFIPTGVGYALLSRAPSIRERRVLCIMTTALAVFSAILWLFMLWISTHQRVEIHIRH
jgi:hypothetical protein